MTEQIIIPETQFDQVIDVINSIKAPDLGIDNCLFTVKEAARYLKCSTVSFLKIRKEANIQHVYSGKKKLFKKSDLDEYLGIDIKSFFTAQELFQQFKIGRLTVLAWEDAGKVKQYIMNGTVKFKLSEIIKALQDSLKEK